MAEAPRGREDYLHSADEFMAQAVLASKSSRDPSTQVGACIVNQDNTIVGIGYNRMPNGSGNFSWAREAEDEMETKYPYVCHAELNAIMNKTSSDVKGCTMYVTLFPCNECAKLIIQAGIKEVVYLCDKYMSDVKTMASKRLLDAAKIPYKRFQPESTTTTFNLDLNYID